MKPVGPVSKSNKVSVPVPLPTELPGAPSLKDLPPNVLHSATVETLLQQIDDLTARLKVNLRRNSLLEMDLRKAKDNLEFLKERNQSLEMKSLVEKEKELRAERRFETLSSHIQDLQGQLSVYEMRLSQSLTETRNLNEEKQKLAEETQKLQNLKTRIKSRLKNYLHKRTAALKEHNDSLQAELQVQSTLASSTKLRLEETSRHLQEVTQRLQQKETELREREREMEVEKAASHRELTTQIQSLEASQVDQQRKIESLTSELEASEGAFNKAVQLESRLNSLKESYEAEINRLQKDVRTFRMEAKSLALEKKEMTHQITEMKGQQTQQAQYIRHLEDQLESARLLLGKRERISPSQDL